MAGLRAGDGCVFGHLWLALAPPVWMGTAWWSGSGNCRH